MNRKLRPFAGLIVAGLVVSAAAHQALADGKVEAVSPDKTLILSWTSGTTKLAFFDVEKRKPLGSMDLHFAFDEVQFTPSGRYVCVNQGNPNSRVAFVDVLTKRVILQLQGTATRSFDCQEDGATFADPSLPIDARNSNLIKIEQVDVSGPPSCFSQWQVEVVKVQYWDPRLRHPKIVFQAKWNGTAC